MKTISVKELKELQDQGADFQLIDCRETDEYNHSNLGGLHIPVAQIINRSVEVSTDKQVIIHCRSGKRSAMSVKLLNQHKGLDNLYNLEGGILAWSAEIDPSKSVL